MYQSMLSGAYRGMESYLVQVEVDVSDGLPCMEMIGYLSGQVKESRERVRVGIKNSGFKIPPKRITISLSPSDVRKDGSGFDLSVALGVLLAISNEKMKCDRILILGELGLDGSVKGVKGVLPILLKAKEEGVSVCLIPEENQREAAIVKGMQCIAVNTLKQAYEVVRKEKRNAFVSSNISNEEENAIKYPVDFSQVRGQKQARRAAEIAAAGGHNLLLLGPPGTGKTMIAERVRTILPPMTYEECIEVSKIKSILGEFSVDDSLVKERPFETVHHLVTPQALVGGGAIPHPGLITRAHRGVLFLDELPEFGRGKLDLLRQPLEEKKIRIARKQEVCEYSADFMLIAAMNPCPCGYFPDRNRCTCRGPEIAAYLKRISGPLLDRFDLSVEVGKVEWEHLEDGEMPEGSVEIRNRVYKAYEIQQYRQGKLNADLTISELDSYCMMEDDAKRMLKVTFSKGNGSARGYHRIRKVARTVADLEGENRIGGRQMAEAILLNQGLEGINRKGDGCY